MTYYVGWDVKPYSLTTENGSKVKQISDKKITQTDKHSTFYRFVNCYSTN